MRKGRQDLMKWDAQNAELQWVAPDFKAPLRIVEDGDSGTPSTFLKNLAPNLLRECGLHIK